MSGCAGVNLTSRFTKYWSAVNFHYQKIIKSLKKVNTLASLLPSYQKLCLPLYYASLLKISTKFLLAPLDIFRRNSTLPTQDKSTPGYNPTLLLYRVVTAALPRNYTKKSGEHFYPPDI